MSYKSESSMAKYTLGKYNSETPPRPTLGARAG